MYFPYLRGRQFELIALRELLESERIGQEIIPIIEPVKPSATLLKTLECFVNHDREIAVVFNPAVGDFPKKINEMRRENSKIANELYELLTKHNKIIKSYIMSAKSAVKLKTDELKTERLIINPDRDCLDDFLEVYDKSLPRYTLIPDDRAFRRVISESKVLFEDNFNKRSRNISLFDKIGPFSIPDFDMTWFAINIDIIRKIGNEVAMPMRRFDRALDYVPTQYICDYVKHLGYDGIRYKSTLVEGGINYAIFDEKKFDCVGVKVVHIGNIHYEWKEL